MAEDKPCISELFENDVLDMELVGKIAHNELDKQKGFPFSSVSANSIRALASEYIDNYANDPGIIEAYAAELDSQLSVEDYRGGKISPEFMLGCAIGLGAASHANADIDYFSDKFSSRAVIEIEELETCLVDNRLPDGAKASLAEVVELLANVPAEALGAKMESGGEACLTPSGIFDRNSEGVELMKFDLDELEQAAFEGDRDFAADRIVVSAESRKMAAAGIDISQQLTLPMDAGELQDALKAFADMEGVEPSDIVMCDYELHGRFSEYSWHDFGTDDPIADMNRFAQIVVDHPDLNVGELFYYNDDHEIYDIDDIIDVAEHFDERLAEPGREFNLDELGESKCDEAELVNYDADKSEGNALAGGER